MKRVIDFIVEQKLSSIDDFPGIIKLINENFNIQTKDGKHQGMEAAEMVIDHVIDWETRTEISDSLEKILNENFCLQ